MYKNAELHTFLLEKTKQLTEDWYNDLDKSDPRGVYSSRNPEVIKMLKQQNYEFHLHLCKVFIEDKTKFLNDFRQWILMIAQDEQHLNTPIHLTLREFFKVQRQYLDFVKEFVLSSESEFSIEEFDHMNRTIINTFDIVMLEFVKEHNKFSEGRLLAQQELIMELSSPVILLNNNAALLPLVGDIDTGRAKFMLENTLQQCAALEVEHLFIDLSGVVLIDTMVAQQIFQLIDALSLIGVKTTLSGLRPEIAQTAVQLGLSFEKVSIKPNLAKAIAQEGALFNRLN